MLNKYEYKYDKYPTSIVSKSLKVNSVNSNNQIWINDVIMFIFNTTVTVSDA